MGVVGTLGSTLLNLSVQLAENYRWTRSWRSACLAVDIKRLLVAGAFGFFLPGIWLTALSFKGGEFVLTLAKFLLLGVPAKLGLNHLLPDWRPLAPPEQAKPPRHHLSRLLY